MIMLKYMHYPTPLRSEIRSLSIIKWIIKNQLLKMKLLFNSDPFMNSKYVICSKNWPMYSEEFESKTQKWQFPWLIHESDGHVLSRPGFILREPIFFCSLTVSLLDLFTYGFYWFPSIILSKIYVIVPFPNVNIVIWNP